MPFISFFRVSTVRCMHSTSCLQRWQTQCPFCSPQKRKILVNFIVIAMRWYVYALAKYAVFSGRASGRELWSFTILNAVVLLVFSVLFSYSPLWLAYVMISVLLALILPSMAVASRRYHDFNLHGWWLLAWIIIPVLALLGAFYLEQITSLLPGSVDPGALDEPPCVLPLLVIMVLCLIWPPAFGLALCLPGMMGPNRFGPAPRKKT